MREEVKLKNEENLIHEEDYLFHEEEFPINEEKSEFPKNPQSSNRLRKALPTSPSESEDDRVKTLESKYKKLLADTKKEFEEGIKEYQDQLATKDLDILMLKVQMEGLQQKGEATIDDVIKKTQKHMNNEIAKLKRVHELKITKLLSESKAYYKQDTIDKEKEIAKLKKEIEIFASEPRRTQQEQDFELKKLKDEFAKREEQILSEANKKVEQIIQEANKRKEQIIQEANKREEQIIQEANKREEQIKKEAEAKEKQIIKEANKREEQIKKEAEAKEEQIILEVKPKIEKIISEKQQALLTTNKRYERLKNQNSQLILSLNEKVKFLEKKLAQEEERSKEITLSLNEKIESAVNKKLDQEEKRSKRITPPENDDVDVEQTINQEKKIYKRLENEVNKLQQTVKHLSLEKKDLSHKLDQIKKPSILEEEKQQEPKTPFTEIIKAIVLIAANLFFIFVIYPNIADWVEGIGLNHLSVTIRTLMTAFVIMISLFCFVKAREASQKKKSLQQKERKGNSMMYLLGIITIGTLLLLVFLIHSLFLFFLIGTVLIVLAGLLLTSHLKGI